MRAARSAAARNGIANIAVSEWSLATHHDSRVGCSDPATLRAVFHAETSAFLDAGASSYFWGWKMPRGGAAPFLLGLVTLSRGRGRGGRLGAVRVVDVVHRFVDVVHRVRRLRV